MVEASNERSESGGLTGRQKKLANLGGEEYDEYNLDASSDQSGDEPRRLMQERVNKMGQPHAVM